MLVPWMRPEPVEGGDSVPYTSLLTHEEQAEVLNRLDFVLRSLIELRHEVQELRNSLQSLAGEIIGEVRCVSVFPRFQATENSRYQTLLVKICVRSLGFSCCYLQNS